MRLTLRNLLRFLDRTDLDPLERAQLEELVNKSDRATAWIHRIKTLRSDPRKSAPAVNDHSSIADVTRYIDGTMTEQEAIEFEKTMLASDPLLAEVASVHFLVHQQPSPTSNHVSLVLRQTLYDIDRVYASSAEKVATGGDDTHGNGPPTSMTDLPFQDAPDFDDDPGFESGVAAVGDNGASKKSQPPVSLEQMKRRSTNRSWMVVAIVIGTLVGTTSLSFWLGQQSATRRSVAGLKDTQLAEPKADENLKPEDGTAETDPDKNKSKDPDNDAVKPDVDEPVPPLIVDHPRPPEPVAVADKNKEGLEDRLPRPPDITWSLYTPVPPEEFIGPILPPRVIASSELRQPTVLFKTGNSAWAVVDDQTQLLENSKVRVLSGGQAIFKLENSLTLNAVGPASFSFGEHDRASGADLIVLEFGQIQMTTDLGDVDWLLQVDSDVYRVTMINAQSVVEARTNNFFPPGADPRESTAVRTRVIRSVTGRSGLQSVESAWDLTEGTALIQSQSDVPEWAIPVQHGAFEKDESAGTTRYVERVVGVVDSKSRTWVESKTDIPGELINLKNDPRQEVRLAAMTWLAETGQFEFVVDFFENEDNESNWRTFLQAIRSTIQSEPAYATLLFEGLAVVGDIDQPHWYKLILGFSPDELENGADAQLVKTLGDNSLGIRALAIENLREITGGNTYGYLPTHNTAERTRTIKRQWEPMWAKQQIRYETPPAPELPRVKIAPLMPDPAGGDSEKDDDSGSK